MSSSQTDTQALLLQAEDCLKSGRYQAAADFYQDIVGMEPARLDAWLGLAMAQYRLGRFQDALPVVAHVIAHDPKQVRAYLVKAAVLNAVGNPVEAVQAADVALQIDPNNRFALSSRIQALLSLKRYSKALTTAEKLVQFEPGNPIAHLNRGLALHGLGRPLIAIQAFDQALAVDPRCSDALVNRSSILLELERPDKALQSADAALTIKVEAIALLNRAAALLRLGRPQEALATTEHLLKLNPHHVKGLLNQASALLELADYQSAWSAVSAALVIDPANPIALDIKIKTLSRLNRFSEAETEARAVLIRNLNPCQFKFRLVEALIGLKNYIEAERYLDEILAATPERLDAILLKVQVLLCNNHWQVALDIIEQAQRNDPDHMGLCLAQSAVLLTLERYAETLTVVDRILKLNLKQPQAAINRIAALNGLHRFAEALDDIQKLLESGMIDWQLYANQGGALAGLERLEEAQRAFTQADHLDHEAFQAFRWRHEVYGVPSDALMPDLDPRAEFLALRLSRLEGADWNGYDEAIERTEVLIEQCLGEGCLTPLPTFKALSLPLSLELTAAISRSRGEFLASGMASARHSLAFSAPASSVERLKVGYVSADFRNHPTAHLISGLFRVHNRDRFEIHIYALCKDDGSAYYSQIKLNADRFTDLTGMSNTEAATRIHADGIHILIDLMGYTAYARTEIFALQPAPVQVSYLGYPGTMGAPFIPYIIADPVTLPETLQPFFTEQPVYLPESYQVNDQEQTIATTGIVRKDQGLPETGMVFCCFNKPSKFDPVMFSVWMRILSQVPGSVLWLLAASKPDVASNLRREAESRGIAGERLIFAERLPKDRHLERHRLADLFLDTRIYNAHTTASDALWAGLPVLTGIGQTFQARVAASLLQAVEMPELITHSLEEYESLAVRLATHPAELAGLREKLAHNRLRTPLFDTERFARHLEQAYAMMWDRYSRNLPPAPLHVPPLPRV
ncbi:MAG: tetratricopeptide repeat protein [Gammaproteobacteria bacterium]|nr:tetratricopeptide repeat protein [Gammaproteobacteria bacterium]